MTKQLIQKPSGHIYVATPALEKRQDMYLYKPEKEATATVINVEDGDTLTVKIEKIKDPHKGISPKSGAKLRE